MRHLGENTRRRDSQNALHSTQARDRLEQQRAGAQPVNLGTLSDERIRGEQMQRIAGSAEAADEVRGLIASPLSSRLVAP